jgi:SAM-dependent methyltransferase
MNAPGGSGGAAESLAPSEQVQVEVNLRRWAAGGFLRRYRGRALRPAESVLFATHSEALRGRVLELGCGGGRLSGHLIALATSLHGMDIAADMVAHCRRTYPTATFSQGDLRDLSGWETAGWDAVVAGYAVVDVLGDGERRALLDEVHRLLRPGGILIFSSHNLAFAPLLRGPIHAISFDNPVSFASQIWRLPRSLRNHRRLVQWERFEADYAILNNAAHDFSLLHYYISRDGQERQLGDHGFELLECVGMDGRVVQPGEPALAFPELHYAALRSARDAEAG